LREDVDAMTTAAEQGRRLARQLLVLGRGQALEMVPVDVHVQLRRFASVMRRALPSGVTLETDLRAAHAVVLGDLAQLEQVFMNLVVNARDAVATGGRISLTTELVELDATFVASRPWMSPGTALKVEVADTGLGMTPAVLERVFDPFFTTKAKGTGLGLAVCFGIVRQHLGAVTAQSTVGVGSRLAVHLPLQERVAAAAAATPPAAANRILVAEDNAPVRFLFERALRSAGLSAVVVDNGEEAVRCATREPFAVAILDVAMPKLDGRAALGVLRGLQPHLKFVFCGGDVSVVQDLAEPGRVELLPKPFELSALIARVRRLLDVPAVVEPARV